MRFDIFRTISCSFVFILIMFSNTLAADRSAEFAIRWNPSKGGPKTANDVINLLELKSAKMDEYKVSYFAIETPFDVPDGYSVIARRRTQGEKTQLMIKYRGDAPLPDTYNADAWQCVLGSNAESKYEVDITFLLEKIKKTYSLSCSLKAEKKTTFPDNLNPAQVGCDSKMKRYESNGIKIEEWSFDNGNEKLLEVSKSGHDNDVDIDKFRNEVSSKLISSGVKPLESSKSATGTDCTK
ncbi:hypothetical protein ACH50O_17385 [Methylomonas sp. 2BW1-5-20]|uniref:hypothetical protein n=1 Tax=Methylomonas sp. 2BW1-5-20 TaxID=3376686 RepID=UPI00404E3A85